MEPITFTRDEAISYLASALHNFTVRSAADIARTYGMEAGTLVVLNAAAKDTAALEALGVASWEIELADIVHAH